MIEKLRLLKVLNDDLTSPFQGFQFEIGKTYEAYQFDPNPSNDCSNGFYATDVDGLSYSYGPNKTIYECDVWGRSVEINEFKRRYEYMRLVKRVDIDTIKQSLEYANHVRGYNVLESVFPFNPFSVVNKPNKRDWKDLNKVASVRASVRASVGASVWASVWASVGDSVGASAWASVWASVGDSVGASAWASVWASVRASAWASVGASVGDSVGAYISSLFPGIKKWEYIDHKPGENPLQPYINLWHRGFVPIFIDGKSYLCNKKGRKYGTRN